MGLGIICRRLLGAFLFWVFFIQGPVWLGGRSLIMREKVRLFLIGLGIVLTCILVSILLVKPAPEVGRGEINLNIKAQRWAYEPYRVVVNRGDRINLKLASRDVVHGFFLEAHDIEAAIYPGRLQFHLRHPSSDKNYTPVEQVVFDADRSGKYYYRCSVTCGTLHPFMLGELIVQPNYPFRAAVGGAIGILLAGLILMFMVGKKKRNDSKAEPSRPWRLDLLEVVPGLKWLLKRKWLQFAFCLFSFACLILFIIAGFWGSPIGNRNISITIVWILWWFLLISFMLPFGSRIWCMMCPFPFLGEWLQRRRLLGPDADIQDIQSYTMSGLRKKWPAKLSNIWLQNLLFLTLCTFSAMLVTRPVFSAFILLGFTVVATLIHFVYRKRTFCNHICPVGGWMGLYSMAAMVEVRAKDPDLCIGCKTKGGATGNGRGWACPWCQYPSRLRRNNHCGFCMECIKSCDHNSMTLRARPFCSDIEIRGYDEAWMAFIMMALAIIYSATYLGPWGILKNWANVSEVQDWQGFSAFAGVIWFSSLLAVPALWFLLAWLGKKLSGDKEIPIKKIFLSYSYLLVPLGLLAWASFSLPAFMLNITHILSSISDPMGWGWDLFGMSHLEWKPFFPEYIPYIQIALLLTGLGFVMRRGYDIAQTLYGDAAAGIRSFLPFGLLCTGITIIFLRLFAG